MPSVVPKIDASMSCTATALPASSAPTKPFAMNQAMSAARARVHERRPGHPDRIAAALALVDQQSRHQRVVDRLLARHLARHELELALARLAEERRRCGRRCPRCRPRRCRRRPGRPSRRAALRAPRARRRVEHERRVHARLARHPPRALHAHVGRQVGRREEAFRAARRRPARATKRASGASAKLRAREVGMGEDRSRS